MYEPKLSAISSIPNLLNINLDQVMWRQREIEMGKERGRERRGAEKSGGGLEVKAFQFDYTKSKTLKV